MRQIAAAPGAGHILLQQCGFSRHLPAKRTGRMRFWEWYRVILGRFGAAVHIPRHAGSFAAVGLIGGIACFGMIFGGHAGNTLKLASALAGLGVDKVQISGNKRVSEIDVLQALGLDGDTALPALNIAAARAALTALPWVDTVSLRKIYPDRLAVAVTEKQAFAVWQEAGAVHIIDRHGSIIIPYNSADGRGLPLFVGAGAGAAAADFLAGMRQFPDLAGRARAYIRIAGRRWDILLENGLRIELPEEAPFARLRAAAALDKSDGLFSRDIEVLDLRLADRMTVSLGSEALARRAAAVAAAEKREKAIKAAALKNGGQA